MRRNRWIPILAFLSAISLFGCATPPEYHFVAKSKTYEKTKDEVWSNLIAYFTSHSIQIKTIEKVSGVIYAEKLGFAGETYADCGTPGIAKVLNTVGSFNVFVEEVGSGSVRVTVNANYVQSRQFDVNYWTVDCYSTGQLEREILGRL